MRVLLLTDSNTFAGTERHILSLAEQLPAFDVDVRIASPACSVIAEQAARIGISHVAIEKSGILDPRAIWTLWRLLRSGEVDIVHAHNGRTALNAVTAQAFARQGYCVTTQHFIEPAHTNLGGLAGQPSRWVHRWMNHRVSCIICVSDAVREALLKREHLPKSRATTIPNGISDRTQSGTSDREQLRRELGLKADAPLIACVSRLEQEKNVTCLISAMAAVAGQFSDAVCLIVGDGSQMGLLTDQCNASGLTDNIRLLGFRNDAMAIMDIADLIVLPSRAEPFGLVLLEAMSLEKPVVAINAGGPREIVVDQETGFLVPPSDPAMLAKAISRLLTDNQLRTEMGRRGYQRFASHYTSRRMAELTAVAYTEVMKVYTRATRDISQYDVE